MDNLQAVQQTMETQGPACLPCRPIVITSLQALLVSQRFNTPKIKKVTVCPDATILLAYDNHKVEAIKR